MDIDLAYGTRKKSNQSEKFLLFIRLRNLLIAVFYIVS